MVFHKSSELIFLKSFSHIQTRKAGNRIFDRVYVEAYYAEAFSGLAVLFFVPYISRVNILTDLLIYQFPAYLEIFFLLSATD